MPISYHESIKYMKELKSTFNKNHSATFKLGKVYQGNLDYSYFSLTTQELKKQKLKFVIVLNLKMMCFEICLSGQNKSIRKKYWQIFKDDNWQKYHLAESIEDSLSILDHTIIETPDFKDKSKLTCEIEMKSIKFINEIQERLA